MPQLVAVAFNVTCEYPEQTVDAVLELAVAIDEVHYPSADGLIT